MSAEDDLFPGFVEHTSRNGNVETFARVGGQGPPLVLLHGYPETHVCWHRVAGELATRFTVVLPDLRGYGRSSLAVDDAEHRAYAKRTMAKDIQMLMDKLGYGRFAVMGHGRGGRVGYRLALDRPDRIEKLALIDILVSIDQWELVKASGRRPMSHWTLMAQPSPIPESLIGSNPVGWIESRWRRATQAQSTDILDSRALKAYREVFTDPDRIHAACEDFRAGATCDLVDEATDREEGRTIACPLLILWGTSGHLAEMADPVAPWRAWCPSVEGKPIDSGHFMPEENPEALLAAVIPFLTGQEAKP